MIEDIMRNVMVFTRELAALINKHGIDAQTSTPDYILAERIVADLSELQTVQPEPKSVILQERLKVKPDGWSL
jgi:hypothetical protein